MDLRIFTEPQQGAHYSDLLAVARTAEDAGFEGFFRSDHFHGMGDGDALPGPTDAWTTLAGLARETERLRLGTLVTSATFRHPGVLAVQVAQVDHMSGGRVELGLGAGWFEREHAAYGIPFPDTRERFDRFSEQLDLITGLWETPVGERYSFSGDHYQLTDSPALPKPQQERVPVIIGGTGKRRTPALAARYADEFNGVFTDLETTAAQFDRVRAACTEAGRDPGSMTFSIALAVVCGSDDSQVRQRADNISRDLDELRDNHLAGTPDQIVEKLGRYADLGCSRAYLQVLDLSDLQHLEDIASTVMPQLRA